MRAGNLFSNRDSAALDAPETTRAAKGLRAAGLKRSASVEEMPLRRDTSYYSDDDEDFSPRQRAMRINLRDGLLPKTLWGRIAAGAALAAVTAMAIGAAVEVHSFLLRDARFTVPSEEAIEIAGASHLTHAQLLSIFGEDVDRNIFLVPLNERRLELERLPWVEHVTVMRLLPDHLRVAVVERTPVAFVRQGHTIGLVDANGVLFDLPSPEMVTAGGGKAPHYSFPVLTGISGADPLSTRAARMKLYMAFVAALDATGEKLSGRLSEVDLSDPEDVRAVIPAPGGSDVLVHFGEDHFLERYQAFQQHLAEWRAQYPRLASADMRYEQQVVLGMKQDASPASATPAPTAAAPKAAAGFAQAASSPAASATASGPAATRPAVPAQLSVVKPAAAAALHPVAAKNAARPAAAKGAPAHWAKRLKKRAVARAESAASHPRPDAAAPPPTHAISEIAR